MVFSIPCSVLPICQLALMKVAYCVQHAQCCDGCRAKESSKVAVSPITGELIPVDQMAEHMRISLIDPKFQEQRQAMMAKIRETTKASDDEIGRNLMGLARKRPDVFGKSCATLLHAQCPHLGTLTACTIAESCAVQGSLCY